jgi:hypothetical protein
VSQQSIRISISLAAKREIPIKTPTVIQACRLAFSHLDGFGAQRFELLRLAGVDFEIRC